jgi:hypothetical protein
MLGVRTLTKSWLAVLSAHSNESAHAQSLLLRMCLPGQVRPVTIAADATRRLERHVKLQAKQVHTWHQRCHTRKPLPFAIVPKPS